MKSLNFTRLVQYVVSFTDEWINSVEAKERKSALQGQREAAAESSKANDEENIVVKGDPEMVPLYLQK